VAAALCGFLGGLGAHTYHALRRVGRRHVHLLQLDLWAPCW
jgi:hypothetical protein